MSENGGYGDYGLKTIDTTGQVPETRMRNAAQVQSFVRRLWFNDSRRAWKRSVVNGLVDGNPPYKQSKLREAGRAEACNVNFGTGRTYLESGSGAFYDLSNEAPGSIAIHTSYGSAEDIEFANRVMSEEADLVLTNDPTWDFEMQLSQNEMTQHGRGPFMFETPFAVLPRAFHDADLKVPERTKADTKYWEVCSVDVDYYPPELYAFIENESAAVQAGWDVEYTKSVITNAMDIRQPRGHIYDWQFYQQEMKNNSLSYYDDSKVCHIAHVFWKEFDGRITHAIVERETTATNADQGENQEREAIKYLFVHVGRYGSFREVVHPMYYDRGNGGFHHSVTGLGTKMYGAMEYENRLLCNLMDKAFAPKILFKPTSAESNEKFNLVTMGDWGRLPAGWDVSQVPIQGFLTDGLAMYRASSDLIRSNLSSYRQQAPTKQQGNPMTARQASLEASQNAALSKTTFNRYYKQLDALYTEIVRRLCNLNTTDERAKEFQKRCIAKGVRKESLGRVERVTAVRVIGQGSAFLRQEAVQSIMPIVGRLPEDGQRNWTNDFIASAAGQNAVNRYNPGASQSRLPTDQQFNALEGVTMMKVGVPPIVTSTQNPVTFAATYLSAGSQAIQSVQQGGNPMEVLGFLELCGPAILAHLRRFAQDPLREPVFKELYKQWQDLASVTDQLKQFAQKAAQKQKDQQGKTQEAMSEAQIKQAKAQNDIAIKTAKTKAQLQMQAEKHKQQLEISGARTRQDLALADARTASDIHRSNRESQAAQAAEEQEPETGE